MSEKMFVPGHASRKVAMRVALAEANKGKPPVKSPGKLKTAVVPRNIYTGNEYRPPSNPGNRYLGENTI